MATRFKVIQDLRPFDLADFVQRFQLANDSIVTDKIGSIRCLQSSSLVEHKGSKSCFSKKIFMRHFGKSLDIQMFFALSPFRGPFVIAASPRYVICGYSRFLPFCGCFGILCG